MALLQYVVNGVLVGALYAALAVGFSLVWGVLNVINMMHGSFVVLGAYFALIAVGQYGVPPLAAAVLVAAAMFALGYLVQRGLINRVLAEPMLTTLTLTFGLDLILNNAMIQSFSATPRSLALSYGSIGIAGVELPVSRLIAMGVAVLLTALLMVLLRFTQLGRSIIAARMDSFAAGLLGVNVPQVYAVTFGIGALMAGVAGCAIAIVFPITPVMSGVFLGKAFVICILGGLGSVSGAIVGGLALGLLESFGAVAFGSQWASTVGFVLMLLVLVVMPSGLAGRKGFE